MTRVSGTPTPYASLFNIHLPGSLIAGKSSFQAALFTLATSTSTDVTAAVSPAFDLSIHSIVATVYGAAGTGSLTLGVTNININGNLVPTTIVATTLVPQVFSFKKGFAPIAASVFGSYAFFSSSSWAQSAGGVYINVNAYL